MAAFKLISDTHQRLKTLISRRLPWLLIGLVGGTAASFMVSSFENVLRENIQLAFFVPMIVYMSDAVGTQTETIFVRDLTEHRANFFKYIWKELYIGLSLGVILGVLIGVIAYLWLHDMPTALTVALAMFVNVTVAPVLALVIPEALFKEHKDPALGAGPFTTVVQDFISLFIYFVVATLILWHK
jgi:magnesium transporter